MNKKGVSAIVATSLILLITVAAVTVLWGVVIPLVRDNLNSAQACINAPNAIEIVMDTGKTCYSSVDGLKLQIRRTTNDINISKLNIMAINGDGNSENKVVDLTDEALFGSGGLNPGDTHVYTQLSDTRIVTVEITPVVRIGATDNECGDAIVRAQIPECA